MKKIVYCFIIAFLSLQVKSVYAKEQQLPKKIDEIVRNEEIENSQINDLYKYAKIKGKQSEGLMTIDNNNYKNYIKVYEVTSNDKETRALITSTEELTEIKNESSILLPYQKTVLALGKDDKRYDKTKSIQFYFRIESKKKNGLETLSNLKGHVVKTVQPGVSISKQEVCGKTVNYTKAKEVRILKYPKGKSFNYNTGFKLYAPPAASSYIGGYWKITLKRGSTWKYTFSLYMHQ